MSGTEILSTLNKTSGSGIDIASLVKNLVAAETQVEQDNVKNDTTAIETKISEVANLSKDLSDFGKKLTTYENVANAVVSNTHSGHLLVKAKNSSSLQDSSYNISVNRLAQEQVIHIDFSNGTNSLTSLELATISVEFGTWSGDTEKSFLSNGITNTITISEGTNSLEKVITSLDNIEGLQANLITNGTSSSLIIRSELGAKNGFKISNTGSDGANALEKIAFDITGSNSADQNKITQSAQDAEINIDGVLINSGNNIFKNAISGAEIKTLKTTSAGETAKISFADDQDSLKKDIRALVSDLSQIKNNIKELTSRGLNGEDDGPLAGDTRATQILRKFEKLTTTGLKGFGQNKIYLSQLGFRTELDGSITFDEKVFDRTLDNNKEIRNNLREIIFGVALQTDNNEMQISNVTNDHLAPERYAYQTEENSDNSYTITLGNQVFSVSPDQNGNVSLNVREGDLNGLNFVLGSNLLQNNSAGFFDIGVGFVPDFKSYVDSLIGPAGELAKNADSYKEQLSELETLSIELVDRKKRLTDRYSLEFGKMETSISGIKRSGEYITSLVDMWNNYNK
ncbi:MAG: hypothetical protein CMM44_06080 [Rhodospirillaceae bacterium]|nr:hypothetical protein [Rhodospirillaceae bacterium]